MGLDNIQNYMIGIILMIVIVTSGVLIMGDFTIIDTTLDDTNEIGTFSRTLNKSAEITESVGNIETSIDRVTTENTGVLGWLNALVGSVFNGLKAVGGTLSFMDVAAAETGEIFGIPSEILGLIMLITIIIIGFAIYSAIMRL
jgi:hypothetical protein